METKMRIGKLLTGTVAGVLLVTGVFGASSDCGMDYYFDGKDFPHGAYWVDKHQCQRHYQNTFSAKKAKMYGIYYGVLEKTDKQDYAETKIKIKVSNHCYFLEKGANGWKRSEWRKIDNNTLELNMGNSSVKGADLLIGDVDKKKAWNVFSSPLNCAEEPQREEWTVLQKIHGHWQITGRQRFIINP